MGNYEAESIRVLIEEEADERFPWKMAESLSSKYSVPLSCVYRGLEASSRLGIPADYYINRYLAKDGTKLMPEFTDVYKEVLLDGQYNYLPSKLSN